MAQLYNAAINYPQQMEPSRVGNTSCAGVLWRVAPNLVLFLFAYTAIGTFLTTSVFGKKLMQLTYTILQREGDLRFNLVRTRENSGAYSSCL